MSKLIHLNQKSNRHGHWVSFENDPYLTTVKKTIHERCLPCIEHLYRQLREGRYELELSYAFDCWKVVVVLNSDEECLKVLERYQEKFLPSRHIRGRFGSKEEGSTKAIVVNADNEQERDLLFSELEECIKELHLDGTLLCSKACAYLYGELLGDWREWRKVTPVTHPENVEKVIQRLKELLEVS
jgi:hypothetical protein